MVGRDEEIEELRMIAEGRKTKALGLWTLDFAIKEETTA